MELLLKIFENCTIGMDPFYRILKKCKESLHGCSRNSPQTLSNVCLCKDLLRLQKYDLSLLCTLQPL